MIKSNSHIIVLTVPRGRILGCIWDKSIQSFPPCYSQSPLLTNFYTYPPPLPPTPTSSLKLVCDVNIVYGNLKSENSQDYAQKPQRNCTFMDPYSSPPLLSRGERQDVGTRDKPSRYRNSRFRYRLDTGLPEREKGGKHV